MEKMPSEETPEEETVEETEEMDVIEEPGNGDDELAEIEAYLECSGLADVATVNRTLDEIAKFMDDLEQRNDALRENIMQVLDEQIRDRVDENVVEELEIRYEDISNNETNEP